MSKDVMLKRAFNQASSNPAVRFAYDDVDFLVIKNHMLRYAAKNGVSVSPAEIESYIKAQLAKIDRSLKDFTYQVKIMN